MTEPFCELKEFSDTARCCLSTFGRLGRSQGRPVANLGAFIVEKAVEKAKADGEFRA